MLCGALRGEGAIADRASPGEFRVHAPLGARPYGVLSVSKIVRMRFGLRAVASFIVRSVYIFHHEAGLFYHEVGLFHHYFDTDNTPYAAGFNVQNHCHLCACIYKRNVGTLVLFILCILVALMTKRLTRNYW